MLVTAEIAFMLILMAGAGLMTRSLYLPLSADSGFRAQHVMTVEMSLRTEQYDKDPAIRNFWQRPLDQSSSSATPAAAMAIVAVPGKQNFSPNWPIHTT